MVRRVEKKVGVGETAVDGLLAGLAAGVAMTLFLLGAGLLGGTAPAVLLGYFDPAGEGNWLNGLLGHLAVSAVYGVGFALLRGGVVRLWLAAPRYSWLLGVVYGLVLWGLARGVGLTAVDSPLHQIAPLVFALAHLVYGAVLGYWLQR